MKTMRREEGFTLIELMIVVAIIAIIAAIAIPSLLNARKAGNEASAISSLRTLTTVNEQYRTRFQNYSDDLDGLTTAGYIAGYTFDYSKNGSTWSCKADPVSEGNDGDRHFFVDQSGIIRFSAASEANATSSPIDSGATSSGGRRRFSGSRAGRLTRFHGPVGRMAQTRPISQSSRGDPPGSPRFFSSELACFSRYT